MSSNLTGRVGGTNYISGAGLPIFQYLLGSPAVGATTAVHAAVTLAAGSSTTVSSFSSIAVPRNVTVTGNQGSVTGNVIITGTNIEGNTITETIASSGSSTVVGTKAFKTVTQALLPVQASSGDTIAIGTGAVLGLPTRLSYDSILAAYLATVREATRPTITVHSTNIESNTIALSSTLNSTAVLVTWHRADSTS